jgi:hypothetical protein
LLRLLGPDSTWNFSRLPVKFPQILSSVDMEEEAAQTLKATLVDLTKWTNKLLKF